MCCVSTMCQLCARHDRNQGSMFNVNNIFNTFHTVYMFLYICWCVAPHGNRRYLYQFNLVCVFGLTSGKASGLNILLQ